MSLDKDKSLEITTRMSRVRYDLEALFRKTATFVQPLSLKNKCAKWLKRTFFVDGQIERSILKLLLPTVMPL